MKIISLILIASLITIFFGCSNDKEEVSLIFNDFKASMTNKDGEKAATYLDSKSLAWYDNIKTLALTATEYQLKAKNVMTKLTVLALRQNFTYSEIEEMDARQIFSFTVGNSFYKPLDIAECEIVDVEVEDEKAVVACKNKNSNSGTLLKFIKENETWKVNFAFIVNLTNRQLAESSATDEAILILVRAFSKDTLKNNIWEPMK